LREKEEDGSTYTKPSIARAGSSSFVEMLDKNASRLPLLPKVIYVEAAMRPPM